MSRNIILTFDDGSYSHFGTVAPLLKQYGFGATLFVCGFERENSILNPPAMSSVELKALVSEGFEIGNHTMSHKNLDSISESEIEEQISSLEKLFAKNGLPKACSFAYPGGPYSSKAVPVIRRHGYTCARTNIQEPLNMKDLDMMRIPGFPVTDKYPGIFDRALGHLSENTPVLLIYHGIPDSYTPASTSPADFSCQMKYLHDKGCTVTGLSGFFALNTRQ